MYINNTDNVLLRDLMARSRKHCCNGNAKMRCFYILGLHVTLWRFHAASNSKCTLRSSGKVFDIFVRFLNKSGLPRQIFLQGPIPNLTEIRPVEAAQI
jgi:hypothetical protein